MIINEKNVAMIRTMTGKKVNIDVSFYLFKDPEDLNFNKKVIGSICVVVLLFVLASVPLNAARFIVNERYCGVLFLKICRQDISKLSMAYVYMPYGRGISSGTFYRL